MKTQVLKSFTRGSADHGWLKAKHSFSFASYYNPDRMGFGQLRVINDDIIAPAKGFGTHPHQDMEIITIPLEGSLAHKDSEGNSSTIRHGEVQMMSAGTGILHSEFNASNTDPVNLLQIWVLPEKKGIAPRYDQKVFEPEGRKNQFQRVVAPLGDSSDAVQINQQAYFSLVDMDEAKELSYELKSPKNGLYVFVIDGELEAGGEKLERRDALTVEDASNLNLKANKSSQVLIMEVPMLS